MKTTYAPTEPPAYTWTTPRTCHATLSLRVHHGGCAKPLGVAVGHNPSEEIISNG